MLLKHRSVYEFAALACLMLAPTAVKAQNAKPSPQQNTEQTPDSVEHAARDPRKLSELVRFTVAQEVVLARRLRAHGLHRVADQTLDDALNLLREAYVLSDRDAQRMAEAVQANLDDKDTDPEVQGASFDVIRGRILDHKDCYAVIDVNLNHGMHNWQRGYLVRSGKIIDTFALEIMKGSHAGGWTDWRTTIQPSDEIVFYRKRPAEDRYHPANKLIGKRVKLTLLDLPPEQNSNFSVRIYDIVVDAFGEIVSLITGDDAEHPNLSRYDAVQVAELVADSVKLVLDKPTEQLITPDRLAERDQLRDAVQLAIRRAEEAERLQHEARERAATARRKLVADYAQRHLVPGETERKWKPAAGYEWVDPKDSNCLDVRWKPGMKHPDLQQIALASEGEWTPIRILGDQYLPDNDSFTSPLSTLSYQEDAHYRFRPAQTYPSSGWSFVNNILKPALGFAAIIGGGIYAISRGSGGSDNRSEAQWYANQRAEEAKSQWYAGRRAESAARQAGSAGP